MATAVMIFFSLALLILVAGAVIIARAIPNAPVARETDQGLVIMQPAQPVRRQAGSEEPSDDAKLHGTNPLFS
jgi:hypothetical protein